MPPSGLPPAILLIDDDPHFLELAGEILAERFHVDSCRTVEEALERLAEQPYEAILTDLEFHPDLVETAYTGVAVIALLHERHPDLPIIVLSKTRDVLEVADAFRQGAFHFITKHFYLPEVVNLVERAIHSTRLEQEVVHLRRRDALRRGELIYRSPAMVKVLDLVERYARSEMAVLVTGESGTGKELIAQEIHRASGRKGAFHSLNAVSFGGEIFEDLLYGHEKGAFTGADQVRQGLLELADGGTVFLDEVGAIDPERQARLLRLLESKRTRRVGSSVEREVDVRFVFATNEDLHARLGGEVRSDFWHRVARLHIHLPPLRERGEDVLHIAHQILATRAKGLRLSEEGARALLSYEWPGNVRELQSVLERARLLDEDGVLDRADLVVAGLGDGGGPPPLPTEPGLLDRPLSELLPYDRARDHVLRELQRRCVDHALAVTGGRITAAAELLGVSRQTLHTWLNDLGYEKEADAG